MELVTARQRCCGAMTAGANGGLEYSPRWGCVANTAYNKNHGGRPPGACLSYGSPNFPRRGGPVRGSKWNTLLASGHRVQTWSKVERQHFQVLPFCVSPLPSGKLVRIGTPVLHRRADYGTHEDQLPQGSENGLFPGPDDYR